jgi:hypothetical protein
VPDPLSQLSFAPARFPASSAEIRRRVKRLRAWAVAFVALWWLWILLVGEWNHDEWIAATGAAIVAASIGELARARAGVNARVPARWLVRGWSAFLAVFSDFGIVMWALLRSARRREIVRGTFRAHEIDAGGSDPEGVGIRTWRALLADYSPNAYVVEIDRERGLVLLHDLIPRRSSEQPA